MFSPNKQQPSKSPYEAIGWHMKGLKVTLRTAPSFGRAFRGTITVLLAVRTEEFLMIRHGLSSQDKARYEPRFKEILQIMRDITRALPAADKA